MSTQQPVGDSGRGSIVTTSSIAASTGSWARRRTAPPRPASSDSRFPSRDLAISGIRINAIVPGRIETPIYGVGESAKKWKAELAQDALFPMQLGRPEDFATLTEHLIEDDYLNAETIRLEAGTRPGARSR
jgi:NAD(P)-dependent dehydrogenase (short-subunit alcohol dehydrogenase family)